MRLDLPTNSPTASTMFQVPPPPSARSVSPLLHWDHVTNETYNPNTDPNLIHHTEIYGLGLSKYLIRVPSQHWWSMVEHRERDSAKIGERFLVRKDENAFGNQTIITEYISTRIDTPAKWSRQSVVYYEGAASPYEYHHDRFTDRFSFYGIPDPLTHLLEKQGKQ